MLNKPEKYYLHSVKGCCEVEGSLSKAIALALEFPATDQPSFVVDIVTEQGETVAKVAHWREKSTHENQPNPTLKLTV